MTNRIGITILVTLVSLLAGLSLRAEDNELLPVEGIRHYEMLVRQYPSEASYHNALGYYYLKASDFQKAEHHFLKAIQLDGSFATGHNNLGVLYLQKGLLDLAENEFRQAVELDSNYSKALYNLAVVLFHKKHYFEAANNYRRVRALDAEYVEQRNNSTKIKAAIEQLAKEKR